MDGGAAVTLVRTTLRRLTRGGAGKVLPAAVTAMAVRMIGAGGYLLLQLVVVRAYSESALGLWQIALAVTLTASLAVAGGHPLAVVRLRATLGQPEFRRYLRSGAVQLVAVGLAVGALSALGLGLAQLTGIHSRRLTAAIVGLAAAGPWALMRFYEGLQRSRRRTVGGYLLTVLGFPLLGSLAVPAGRRWWASNLGPMLLLAGVSVVLGGFALGYLLVAGRSERTERTDPAVAGDEIRHWRREAARFMWFAGSSTLMNNADIVLLGLMTTLPETAVYAFASRLVRLTGIPLEGVNFTLAPRMAQMWAENDRDGMRDALRAGRVTSLAGFVVAAAALGVVELFGDSLSGTELFGRGLTTVALLMAGRLVSAAAGPLSSTLNMMGRASVTVRILLVGALANIAMNLVLIPLWGAPGAALASSIALGGINLAYHRALAGSLGPKAFANGRL